MTEEDFNIPLTDLEVKVDGVIAKNNKIRKVAGGFQYKRKAFFGVYTACSRDGKIYQLWQKSNNRLLSCNCYGSNVITTASPGKINFAAKLGAVFNAGPVNVNGEVEVEKK